MKVVGVDTEKIEFGVTLGDLFVDTDHNGLYLAARIESQFALVGFEGDYWGVWDSIDVFKKEIREFIVEGRFIHYSQVEYELELARKQVRN